jgi:endogenous inhibitor of DNA gyrase (YacG/DUF329 family)
MNGTVEVKCGFCNKRKTVDRHRLALSKEFFCNNSHQWSAWRKRGSGNVPCHQCGKTVHRCKARIKRAQYQFCSPKCSAKGRGRLYTGKKHPAWRGGRINSRGYVGVYKEYDAKGVRPLSVYVLEHRDKMEKHLSRPLKKFESVHHKNGIKTDNRIENLELWATAQPSGQRVQDLVSFVVTHYRSEVIKALG